MSRYYEILKNGQPLIRSGDVYQFRITFNALIDFGAAVSYLDLSIYNLSNSTADKIGKVAEDNAPAETISLIAGYDGQADLIFSGATKQYFRDRKGPDTITRILAVGGSFNDTQIIKTFGVNTKLSAILEYIVNELGSAIDYNPLDFQFVYPSGYTMNGGARGYMAKLSAAHGFNYTQENSRLVIVKDKKTREGPVLVINQFNGLEGIPEITTVGINVKTRLNPKVKIGGKIQVDSKYRSFNFSNMYFNEIPAASGLGEYEVSKISHSGDSHGTEWSTTIDGLTTSIR